MKKLLLFTWLLITALTMNAQNTFPTTGNVGIGTTSPQQILHVSSQTSGDANLIIEADTDNNNEADNPTLMLKQDGGAVTGILGLTGNPGVDYENALTNALYLNNKHASYSIQLVTNNKAQLTILPSGKVGIGTTVPSEKLQVDGTVLTNQIRFNQVNYDFSAAPRTQLGVYGFKIFDDYHSHRPGGVAPGNNNYGTLLAIYGRSNHWEHNLYFGANKDLWYRTSTWTGGTAENGVKGDFHEWRKILDSKSNIASTGDLKISGSGNHYISAGNFGIGTSAPQYKLHISGDTYFNVGEGLQITSDNNYYGTNLDARIIRMVDGNGSNASVDGGITFEAYSKTDGISKDVLTLRGNGNIGIGTTSPAAKLDVNGNIRAERIDVINDVPSSDYVFEENYSLRPIEEVEEFIKENKHLPEVPSAAEFKENGYSVGQMDDILLRKVEELTLYIIELEKRMQSLEKENKELKTN